MAKKMYYTLEEAAERLGVSESQVKEMAAEGKLDQFRDRDKLMYKREQVDGLAGGGASSAGGSSIIPLADDTDTLELKDGTAAPVSQADTKAGTGVNVFETGEMDSVDPAAQTQVTSDFGDEDNLALESVGSGSGLLDLTRESDDTSLGAAELLEEISSGSASQVGASGVGLTAIGSSGVFESAIAMEPGESASGLAQAAVHGEASAGATMGATTYDADMDDPAGSGFSAGMLAGALLTMIIGLIVIIGWIGGVQVPLAAMMTESNTHLMMWSAGLLVISFALGGIGWIIGKAAAR